MAAQSLQENSGRSGGEGGLDLKALREARGLTVNDIYQATRISVTNLESIENGEFQYLPPPIYTKAYINAYAKLLEVDAKQIIIRYDKYLAALVGADGEETCQLTDGSGFFLKRSLLPHQYWRPFSLPVFIFTAISIFRYPIRRQSLHYP